MAKVYLILMGKGGVGKSFVTNTLAQYKFSKGHNPMCIDTDPVNPTFAGFEALNVKRLNIMNGDEINPRHFDKLIELIAEAQDDVIIDNGASSFIPLSSYLISNEIPTLLTSLGHELVIHTPIAGGQSFMDTLNGFSQLAAQFPTEAEFVVWLNPYSGPVDVQGKSFEELQVYKKHKDRIAAIVNIPALKENTFKQDLQEMLKARKTFDEAIASTDLPMVVRHRLGVIKKELFSLLDNAPILAG
ncbi:cellulose biosynthesis protein BcsQ [Pseudomonas duriflava]|uniref:Cellulose biosynthesis protein BcsQ n=1 Tax=Pseudomonas duriflava TaxID=459528 RepID=A0A562PI53_9PSED|nr:conjugal transfer protein TraL [Pseudomonas duriflava]TWI43910.1 cellulose biosynthesis protein BcsQ [Pseudomonas duriflava]